MERLAFVMTLKEGRAVEYKLRHDRIWPDLTSELRAAGVRDYSIFLDEATNTLFGVLTLTDNNAFAALPAKPVMQEWWGHMSDNMETHPDGEPISRPLAAMFHLA